MKPTVLVVTTCRWIPTARLAMALANAGFDVAAICPSRHPLNHTEAVRRFYVYNALKPLASVANAIAANPDLIVPGDDLATQHLHDLYYRARHAGKTGDQTCALIERSLGAPASFPVVHARTPFMEAANQEGIRVPRTEVIPSSNHLKNSTAQIGLPAVLKADGTSGGIGVRIVHTLEDAERAFRRLQAPPLLARVVKRILFDQDKTLVWPSLLRRRSVVNAQAFIAGREATSAVACWKGTVLASLHFEVLKKANSSGPASVVRMIENAEMKAAAEKMVRRLNLSGFHGFDFMLEAGTGNAYLIEMNPRATQVGHLTLGPGRDLPAALYAAISGETVQAALPVTESDTISLFPQEWMRDSASALLQSGYHDIPKEAPELVCAGVHKHVNQSVWHLQQKRIEAFAARRLSANRNVRAKTPAPRLGLRNGASADFTSERAQDPAPAFFRRDVASYVSTKEFVKEGASYVSTAEEFKIFAVSGANSITLDIAAKPMSAKLMSNGMPSTNGNGNSSFEHLPTQAPRKRHFLSKPLQVMKFGGTSLADAASIGKVAEIIRAASRENNIVVVVSAMSGVTNKLIEAATQSAVGDRKTVSAIFESLHKQHDAAASVLIHSATERNRLAGKTQELLQQGELLCEKAILLRDLTLPIRDSISSLGERLSAPLVAAALKECGVASEAIEATELVITDSNHGGADPWMEPTRTCCQARLRPLLQQEIVPVITGYIGATVEGALTTLGRGGSDYSATILGASLDADEVLIWTDVEGLLTADPHLVPEARTIPEISYHEAAELAHFGAKVLHPKTLRPVMHSEIPIWIRNTFAPERYGTRITSAGAANNVGVKAITAMSNVAMITVGGLGIGAPDVLSRTLAVSAAIPAEALLISQSSQSVVRLVIASALAQRTVEALHREFAPGVGGDTAHKKMNHIFLTSAVAMVTIAGRNLRQMTQVVERIFGALDSENVNLLALSPGSSESAISFVVAQEDMNAALFALHREFQLGAPDLKALPMRILENKSATRITASYSAAGAAI